MVVRLRLGQALLAGWVGGFVGNALLGVLFSSPLIRGALYDPAWQSPIFIEVTPQRNIAISVIGLIVLSGLHGLLFEQLWPSIPGRAWLTRGLLFGTAIWSIYWLFQEWFIYVTLLKEPLLLALLELAILLCGSLVEGVVIAWLLFGRTQQSLAIQRHDKP
jgi:hypothetical protein